MKVVLASKNKHKLEEISKITERFKKKGDKAHAKKTSGQ